MKLTEHLDVVENFGFDRETLPLEYNGHSIWIIHNDAHVTIDNRLRIHYTLYCGNCDTESITRGRPPVSTNWTAEHICAIKLYTIGPYVLNTCHGV